MKANMSEDAKHPPTVEEVAWNELRRALQAHRAIFRQENGVLTLELQFAGGRMMGVETRTSVRARYKEPPALN